MEYVRWEVNNWRIQGYGRERSIFTGAKKVVSFMWQSWKCGASFVLVLAFFPVLLPLALFLGFVGFLFSVPLFCGAATYYLFFRSFSLPSCITEWFGIFRFPLEGYSPGSPSGEKLEFQNVLKLNASLEDYHRISESEAASNKSTPCHFNGVLQAPAPVIVLQPTNLKSQQRQRTDERIEENIEAEAFNRKVADVSVNKCSSSYHQVAPAGSMVYPDVEEGAFYSNRAYARSSSALHSLGSNYVVLDRGPVDSPLTRFHASGEQKTSSDIGELIEDELICKLPILPSENTKLSSEISATDIPLSRPPEENHICDLVRGNAQTTERRHRTVSIEHNARIDPVGVSSGISGYFCGHSSGGNDNGAWDNAEISEVSIEATSCSNVHASSEEAKALTVVSHVPQTSSLIATSYAEALTCKSVNEKSECFIQESISELSSCISKDFDESSMKSSSSPFSCSALLRTVEGISRVDSEFVTHKHRARHWREEVEETVLSSAIARITYARNWGSQVSDDEADVKMFDSKLKTMTNDQDIVYLLECTEGTEVFSASQLPNPIQYKEKTVAEENARTSSYLSMTSTPCTHQRRLSYGGVLTDDTRVNVGSAIPRNKSSGFTPDYKQQTVHASFSSDYTWPSESSEQEWEVQSNRGTACEESCVDTASSAEEYEEEFDPKPDLVSDPSSTFSSYFLTLDQFTEDWETRRKRWVKESTLGRLVPFAPCLETQYIQTRSMCNPLFEFSSPSPPPRKLDTEDKNHISDLPCHTRFSKRHSAPSEIIGTPDSHRCKLGNWMGGNHTKQFESECLGRTPSLRGHGRSYSASFMESIELNPGEFEGTLTNWWRD